MSNPCGAGVEVGMTIAGRERDELEAEGSPVLLLCEEVGWRREDKRKVKSSPTSFSSCLVS